MEVRGRDAGGGTGPYSFALWAVTDETFTLDYGDTVTDGFIDGLPVEGAGNIDPPGAHDTYTFAGIAGESIYLQRLAGDVWALDWNLLDPDGVQLKWNRISGDLGRFELTKTGNYEVDVYGRDGGSGTGPYSFTLWAVTNDNFTLHYGDTVTDGFINGVAAEGAGNIDPPGAHDTYTFAGIAGESIYLQRLAGDVWALDWNLLDPDGVQLKWNRISGDLGRFDLSKTGNYQVVVYGRDGGSGTGPYSFRLKAFGPLLFSLAIGDTVSDGRINAEDVPGVGNIEASGTMDTYAFSVAAGDQVFFDNLAVSYNWLRWRLVAPSGVEVFNRYVYVDGGAHTLAETGTYLIEVFGGENETGTYSFKLSAVPPPEVFTIQIGDTVSLGKINETEAPGAGSLEMPGWRDHYQFTVTTAGTRVFFDSLAYSGWLRWRLVAPGGTTLFDAAIWSDGGAHTLAETGTYLIEVAGGVNDTGTCSFKLWPVPPPEVFAIQIGDTVSPGKINETEAAGAGSIEMPGWRDHYQFTVTTAGTQVFFDSLASSGWLGWRLIAPSGAEVFNRWMSNDGGAHTLAETGTYLIEVAGGVNDTGTCSFKLWPVPPPEVFAIQIGDTVSPGKINETEAAGAGSIEMPGWRDHYQFTVTTAGTQVFFDSLASSGWLGWRLIAPSGAEVFNRWMSNDGGAHTLAETGTYLIEVAGGVNDTGTYSFALADLRPPTPRNDVAATTKDKAVDLPISRLLANDSDPRGNPLAFSLPSAATTEGGTVAVVGANVRYAPPPDFTGPDAFRYLVDDGEGHTAEATVTVTVRNAETLGRNVITAARNPDGSVLLRMPGIPGQSYQIWVTTEVETGPWVLLETLDAGVNGVVTYLDTAAIGEPQRFYRLAELP